jgi:hypothetical protein
LDQSDNQNRQLQSQDAVQEAADASGLDSMCNAIHDISFSVQVESHDSDNFIYQ